jgi:hypothetical protein
VWAMWAKWGLKGDKGTECDVTPPDVANDGEAGKSTRKRRPSEHEGTEGRRGHEAHEEEAHEEAETGRRRAHGEARWGRSAGSARKPKRRARETEEGTRRRGRLGGRWTWVAPGARLRRSGWGLGRRGCQGGQGRGAPGAQDVGATETDAREAPTSSRCRGSEVEATTTERPKLEAKLGRAKNSARAGCTRRAVRKRTGSGSSQGEEAYRADPTILMVGRRRQRRRSKGGEPRRRTTTSGERRKPEGRGPRQLRGRKRSGSHGERRRRRGRPVEAQACAKTKERAIRGWPKDFAVLGV